MFRSLSLYGRQSSRRLQKIQNVFLSQQGHAETLRGHALAKVIIKPRSLTGDVCRKMEETDSRIVEDGGNDLGEMRRNEHQRRRVGCQTRDHCQSRFGGIMDVRAAERLVDYGDG